MIELYYELFNMKHLRHHEDMYLYVKNELFKSTHIKKSIEHVKLKNIEHWKSILNYIMPNVVTILIRTSKVSIDSVHGSILQNVIYGIYQKIASIACEQERKHDIENEVENNKLHDSQILDSTLIKSENKFEYFMKPFDELKHFMLIRSMFTEISYSTEERMKMSILGMELNISKLPKEEEKGKQWVEIKGFGMELIIPIDESSLCYFLAFVMAYYFPVYM